MLSKILITLTVLSVLLVTLVTLALLVTTTPEVAQLQGIWGANEIVVGGDQQTVFMEGPDNWRATFEGNRVTILGPLSGVTQRREEILEGTYSAVWLKGKGEIDFTFGEGEWKGQVAKGLFKFEGDQLWLSVPGRMTYDPEPQDGKVQPGTTIEMLPVVPGGRPTSFEIRDGWSLFKMDRMNPTRD
jgi:uncharacterized protein (TIGR03067 family)